jgi:hypothetical protein
MVKVASTPDEIGWARHNLEQLRMFRRFDLRAKLSAVEGMADVVRHFAALRAAGKLTEPEARHATGYALHPVVPGEFNFDDQDWGRS